MLLGMCIKCLFIQLKLGTEYGGAVFNETVTFQELDESFDGETYVLSFYAKLIFSFHFSFISVCC